MCGDVCYSLKVIRTVCTCALSLLQSQGARRPAVTQGSCVGQATPGHPGPGQEYPLP